MSENQKPEPQQKDWGYIGLDFVDSIIDLLTSKLLWALFGVYKITEKAGTISGVNTFNINGDQIYKYLGQTVNHWLASILAISILINILLAIAYKVQHDSLDDYRHKIGRIERHKMNDVDPDRGSSKLTDTGSTNPEDKP